MRNSPTTDRERRRVRRLLRRIHALIKDDGWEIRLTRISGETTFCIKYGISRDIVGLCDHEAQRIYVDYRYDVLTTIVHECLHAVYQDLVEDAISELEQLVMRHMTARQARRLYLAAGNALV